MPAVICNTSPLQYLYQSDGLELLAELFGQVQVPEAVAVELNEGLRRNVHLPDPTVLPWLIIRSVRDRTLMPLVTNLGDGEMEVLALGLETPDALLILDDRRARRHALALGLKFSGTLGIMLLAKERGILAAVKPVIERLEALGFRLGPETRQSVLELAGERA
ncbi:MAG: DUF3368 domain-containing protein [Nitrospira sp. SB0675_bin_23]|nr:DUF3368 domain-containing protein [Paracoccaceae bacterium]MYH02267.1 DUF3368 domain-containing protein [Nitrospira sp. SB0675_bin_23]